MRMNLMGLALVALLGGCAVGPGYQRPDIGMPLRWQAAAGGPGAQVPAAWWAAYGSAELDRLMVLAVEGNHDLRAAASRIAQSRAQAQIAGADLGPALGFKAGAGREQRAGDAPASKHATGLEAAFELDVWGRNAQVREAALARVQGSEHGRRALQVALQAEVATTYFSVLSAQDRLVVARGTLANAEAVLRLLQVQRDAGAISGLELLRQQALAASVRADLAPIEQQRQQALDALAVLIGRAPHDLGLGVGASAPLESLRLPPVAADLPASLLMQRPDILQAEADLAAAHADILAARAALFPSIRLTAAGGVESASLASLLRSGQFVYALAAGLSAPLFDGGRLRGQVALTTAREDELVAVYRQSILTALREVEASLVAAQRLAEQSAQQQSVVEHAQAALRLADLRYRNGAIDFTTVLDAQRVLLAAQGAQSATGLARYAASVALYRALGGGAEPEAPKAANALTNPAPTAHVPPAAAPPSRRAGRADASTR